MNESVPYSGQTTDDHSVELNHVEISYKVSSWVVLILLITILSALEVEGWWFLVHLWWFSSHQLPCDRVNWLVGSKYLEVCQRFSFPWTPDSWWLHHGPFGLSLPVTHSPSISEWLITKGGFGTEWPVTKCGFRTKALHSNALTWNSIIALKESNSQGFTTPFRPCPQTATTAMFKA